MDTFGRHLLVEFHGCDRELLNDVSFVEQLMNDAATVADTVVVASVFQPFQPQGVTGVVVLEESHMSIHTWPETGYAAVDFYTCGKGQPEAAYRLLRERLRPYSAELMEIHRGCRTDTSMRNVYHGREKLACETQVASG